MWSVQDSKNRFSAVVEAALAGTPQEVSRRGKPAVVVLSVADCRRLLAEARSARESFAEHLLAFPGGEGEEDPFTGVEARPRDVAFRCSSSTPTSSRRRAGPTAPRRWRTGCEASRRRRCS